MSDLKNERDDFWNIEKLVPKKKNTVAPFVTRSTVSDYTVGGDSVDSSAERKLNFDSMPKTAPPSEDVTYTPENGGLIKRVTIKRYADKYDFYGNFRKAALIYYDYRTDKCDFLPYYSYMPQYSQLNTAQKNYYFFWRESVRRGKYIKSDYSYLYLYVYEILNLPDKIAPAEGIKILCRLWRNYRAELPRIDLYFSVWVQDYCLVYGLPCPLDEIGDFVFDVIGASSFKEFYLSDIDSVGIDGIDALIAYLSDYDWRRGKFASGDNFENYKRYMLGGMYAFICFLNQNGALSAKMNREVIRRDAFPHSLCTHSVKCKLEIEYAALSHDMSLRLLVTAAVRYTENKLRALFGIKSRLAVKDFPDSARRVIDAYFDKLFTAERLRRAKENAPEYEKLYDAPREALSFDGADEIERASWSTTARLVVEDEVDEPVAFDDYVTPEHTTHTPATAAADSIFGLCAADTEALSDLCFHGTPITDDSVAERINEAAADNFGDVILELDGDGYVIIEDYKEEIEQWLPKQ